MSRKYLNDRYCVRCGRKTPSPYLKKNLDKILSHFTLTIRSPFRLNALDIGCGNGRNSVYLKQLGHFVDSLDMCKDYGKECILGIDKFPIADSSIEFILCNYLLMFLSDIERDQIISEIKRVSKTGCIIMVELYPAKDSYCKNEKDMLKMQAEIFDKLLWKQLKYSKGRFIAKKERYL